MTLVKYRPGHAVRYNRGFNNLFDEFFGRDLNTFWGADQNRFTPSVNVVEKDNAFRLELAAPGFDKKDFNLDLDKGRLTISAEIKEEKENKEERYTRREFRASSFSRSFNLPETIAVDKIKAEFKNGVLHIDLPKVKEDKAKKNRVIEIK